MTLWSNESNSVFKSWRKKDKEKILHSVLVSPSLSFQVRPEIPVPDELDEDEDDDGDEKEVDLSVPGFCYLQLLSLTAPLVLPGDSYLVAGKLALSSDFTCLLNCVLLWCVHIIAYFNHKYLLSIWNAKRTHLFYRDHLR